MTKIIETYRQHVQERKELAYAKWRESGYRNKEAWEQFIEAFIILAK